MRAGERVILIDFRDEQRDKKRVGTGSRLCHKTLTVPFRLGGLSGRLIFVSAPGGRGNGRWREGVDRARTSRLLGSSYSNKVVWYIGRLFLRKVERRVISP